MKTIKLQTLLAATAGLFFIFAGTESAAAKAPTGIRSFKVRLNATKATYNEDKGVEYLSISASRFKSDAYSYSRVSKTKGRIAYKNVSHGPETYSGTYDFVFLTERTGTYVERYTGSYTGTTSGSFRIIAMDATDAPLARSMRVAVVRNQAKNIRLRASGADIPNNKLRYVITRQPKVGKLIRKKGLNVTYRPKPGFTGTVTFQYVVIEGGTRSRPATVTLRVLTGK